MNTLTEHKEFADHKV